MAKARIHFRVVRDDIMVADVCRNRYCCRHRRHCPARDVGGDISGSPCQAWSTAGMRRGHNDKRVICLLAWCRWLLTSRPSWAVHENVRGFKRELFAELVSERYDTVFLEVAPSDAGFHAILRPRTYAVCYLRGVVYPAFCMPTVYSALRDVFAGRGCHDFEAAMISSDEELRAAENEARRGLRLEALTPHHVPSADWSYLLTPLQRGYLERYQARFVGARAVDLGSNPDHRPKTSRDGVLPTTTTKSSRWWVCARRRWLLAKELAVLHGYPATPALGECVGVTDAAADRYRFGDIGNCMHVANVGCVVAVALACLQPRDGSDSSSIGMADSE